MAARLSPEAGTAADPRRRARAGVSFQPLGRARRPRVPGVPGRTSRRGGRGNPRRLATRARAAVSRTPGRLRLHSVGVAVAIVLLWATLFSTMLVRADAVDTVRDSAGRSIVSAQRLHAAVSKADATAAANFLAGDQETPDQLNRYDDNMTTASDTLVTLAQQNRDADATRQLDVLARQLPIYNGLVERARANHRLGYPVGAAYLSQASDLAQRTILPATDALITLNAGRLDHAYQTATSAGSAVAALALTVVTAAALAGGQVSLYRRTNRLLNPGLVAASALVAVTASACGLALFAEQRGLSSARDSGYAPMALLAQSRVLALRAHSDENLSLISRGDGGRFDADFAAAVHRLGYASGSEPAPADGTLTHALRLDVPDPATRAAIGTAFTTWLAVHQTITHQLDGTNGFATAVATTLGTGESSFNAFDRQLDAAVTASQAHFEARISKAGRALVPLPISISLALFTAVVLSLLGYQARINEYR